MQTNVLCANSHYSATVITNTVYEKSILQYITEVVCSISCPTDVSSR